MMMFTAASKAEVGEATLGGEPVMDGGISEELARLEFASFDFPDRTIRTRQVADAVVSALPMVPYIYILGRDANI